MDVIVNSSVSIPSITSRTYVGKTKVWVSTRVPIDTFDYELNQASITVSGIVIMKLKDGSSRKLQANISTQVAGANEESDFVLEVKCKREEMAGEVNIFMNSGNSVATRTFTMLGLIFAFAYQETL